MHNSSLGEKDRARERWAVALCPIIYDIIIVNHFTSDIVSLT